MLLFFFFLFFFSLPLVTSNNWTASSVLLFESLVLEVNIAEMLVSLEHFSPSDFLFFFILKLFFIFPDRT